VVSANNKCRNGGTLKNGHEALFALLQLFLRTLLFQIKLGIGDGAGNLIGNALRKVENPFSE